MAHFYSLTDTKGRSVALKGVAGDKARGMSTYTASWNGAVAVHLYHDEKTKRDCARIELMPWSKDAHETRGARRVLYDGPVNADAVTDTQALAIALANAAAALEGADHA